jgi:hypothetical protein
LALLRRVLFAAALAPAGTVLLPTAPAWADQPQQAIQSVINDDQIQRQAPLPERARKSIGEVESEPEIQRTPPANQPDPVPVFSHLDFGFLPYAILALIGIGLLVMLWRHLGSRTGGKAAGRAAKTEAAVTVIRTPAPQEPERDRTFDEIDALAQSGAFTEAVHRLLLLVQARVRNRIEQGIQVSLTSREILRRARLPGEAATAFATLVAAVEVSHFGMQAANAATYALCRDHCRRLLTAVAE